MDGHGLVRQARRQASTAVFFALSSGMSFEAAKNGHFLLIVTTRHEKGAPQPAADAIYDSYSEK
ncbi:hypothetical protein [Thauera butanivorans]|uniref:hypothetical protein n=1 Tax=Thauera butanivorans TaxID=86174 RepID=UPI0012F87351|nr:hypothetical protein [Thauera butanivorans]